MRLGLLLVVLAQITPLTSLAMRRTNLEGYRSPRSSREKISELRRLASSEIVLDPLEDDNSLDHAMASLQSDEESLEVREEWLESPERFGRFLELHPMSCLQILSGLLERMPMHEILRRQYALELRQARNRGLSTELIRFETASTLLTMQVLRNEGGLQTFRDGFVEFAISSLGASFKDDDLIRLACTAHECCGYLNNLADKNIPPELVVILSSLQSAVQSECSETPICVMLGSVFFLRFICPGLVLPHPPGLPLETKTALMQLAKLLQLVSNQCEIDDSHCFFRIRNEIYKLHQPIGNFLSRIAALDVAHFEFPKLCCKNKA